MGAGDRRPVLAFDTYDEAQRDARLRGACLVLDAQWRFWSTPTELTLLEVHSQMFRTIVDGGHRVLDPLVITPPSFGRPAA